MSHQRNRNYLDSKDTGGRSEFGCTVKSQATIKQLMKMIATTAKPSKQSKAESSQCMRHQDTHQQDYCQLKGLRQNWFADVNKAF